MTLRIAILNVLDTCPRPVTAEIVLAFLPGFYDGPEMKAKDKADRLAAVVDGLGVLASVDEVVAIANHHAGPQWKITPNGRAALR